MSEHRDHVGNRVVRIAVGLAALGFGLAEPAWRAPLAAQVIRGAVTEVATNAPLAGVVLSVLDAQGATVLQALSDDKGAFEIRLPGAGTYSLDVKRIGVRRVQLRPFAVADGETRRLDVSVEPLPAVLSSVKVTGRTSCVRNPETNARTAALWEDARAALTAAVITRTLATGTTADSVVRYQRKLDPDTWRVLYETRRRVSVAMDRPFRSLPAEVLSVGGYVTVNQDGSTDYYAPDADVLLSDTFLADHCFKIEAPTDTHLGEIGLAFQPIPERKKPDVKGILWMDAKTAELKTLEFTYTWLPYEHRTGDFGGTVSFFHMPGGRWIVRSWRIRMPEFGTRRSDGVQVVSRYATPQLARISEEGGAVPLDVLLNQSGRVMGTVIDSATNKPVAGITVALEGTSDSSMTAMDGTFELPFVQPGSYTIVLRHPALDSLGIQHLARTLEVGAGSATTVNLRLPTNDEIATRMCNAPVDFNSRSIIRFIIADHATGAPLAKVPAVFSRVPIGEDGKAVADSATSWDVTLDDRGGFLACGLRSDEIVRLEAVPDTPVAWGETVRPRAGAIGWHVIRVGRKK
jgi:hypothetical protein